MGLVAVRSSRSVSEPGHGCQQNAIQERFQGDISTEPVIGFGGQVALNRFLATSEISVELTFSAALKIAPHQSSRLSNSAGIAAQGFCLRLSHDEITIGLHRGHLRRTGAAARRKYRV